NEIRIIVAFKPKDAKNSRRSRGVLHTLSLLLVLLPLKTPTPLISFIYAIGREERERNQIGMLKKFIESRLSTRKQSRDSVGGRGRIGSFWPVDLCGNFLRAM